MRPRRVNVDRMRRHQRRGAAAVLATRPVLEVDRDDVNVTDDECRERFLANLDDAGLSVAEFLWVIENACHTGCVEFADPGRTIAFEEADVWFYLLGGQAGLGYVGARRKPAGLVYWGRDS